jgi:hypothetical protein
VIAFARFGACCEPPLRYHFNIHLRILQHCRSSDIALKGASLMAVGKIVRDRPVPFLYGVMIVTLLALLPLPPLLQNQEYHLDPNDQTLFWDRLPMTLGFAAILSAVVEERVDARAGAALLRPLLAIGIFSLLLWRWTDDLRLYAWAQFFPFISLVLILSLFPPKYTGGSLLGRGRSALCARQADGAL